MYEPKCNDKGVIVREWETGDSECNAYSQEYECGAYIITTLWMQLETEITIAFGIVANAKREENEFTNPQAGRQFLMTGFLHTQDDYIGKEKGRRSLWKVSP